MTGVQHLTVGPDEADQRLDRWLRRQFPQLGQGRIEKMCRTGEVRIDGARAKASSRVAPGQSIRVPPLPDAEAAAPDAVARPAPPAPRVDAAAREALLRAVVFRDDHMIVLNKPAGLAVQGGTGQHLHLGAMLEVLRFGRDDDPRLVHRLDRDTSGLLVLARTGQAAVALSRAFRTRAVEKIYVALVAGRPSPEMGTIRLALAKTETGGKASKMKTYDPDEADGVEGARHAVTDYRVIDHAGNRAAWVALRPVTGRTHQLRAHMAAIWHPIAGDGKYGGSRQDNQGEGWGAGLGQALSRKLHLHAARLVLPHPVSGKRMTFSAPLPEHMARSWEFFGWNERDLPQPVFPD
ncbi:MAG: RluA family pseudouridine synthase [Thermohalobaculum sp.]|nr:RluA family pseudouridine synthase [Thermohalobaculum sp.]